MTDSIQVLLTAVITTLTLLLVIIGIQIFFILTEVRNILKKVTMMVNDVARLTHAVVEPVEEASSFVTGLKKGVGLMRHLRKIFAPDED